MQTTVKSGNPGSARAAIGLSAQTVIVGAFLVAAFWPIVVGMYGSWFDGFADMEHGALVVPAAALMTWMKRGKLMEVPRAPSFWGIILLLLGAAQALLGLAAHWTWVNRMALLVSLVGCISALYGWRMVRELAYPLGTLTLMIAPPTFVFERITLSLQLLASRLGECLLDAIGYPIIREGNILELVGEKLSVEEACSGIRSLPAILFVTVLYDYFFVNSTWMRVSILIMAVPIAILGNAFRIVASGLASQYNRELVHGAAHGMFGYVSVTVAGAGCVLVHILMLYIQKAWRARHA